MPVFLMLLVRMSESSRRGGIKERHGRLYFVGVFEFGRLRSSEVSQSSGGKLIRQKSGDGSLNSTPMGIFPSSGFPREVTFTSISSPVFGLISPSNPPRRTVAFSITRPPWAFTLTVEVVSRKSAPLT